MGECLVGGVDERLVGRLDGCLVLGVWFWVFVSPFQGLVFVVVVTWGVAPGWVVLALRAGFGVAVAGLFLGGDI